MLVEHYAHKRYATIIFIHAFYAQRLCENKTRNVYRFYSCMCNAMLNILDDNVLNAHTHTYRYNFYIADNKCYTILYIYSTT